MVNVGAIQPPDEPPGIPPDGFAGDAGAEVINIPMDAALAAKLKLGNVEEANYLHLNSPLPLSIFKRGYPILETTLNDDPEADRIDRSNAINEDQLIPYYIAAIPELYRDLKPDLAKMRRGLLSSLNYGSWMREPQQWFINKMVATLYTITETRVRLKDFPGIEDDAKAELDKMLRDLTIIALDSAGICSYLTPGNEIADLQAKFHLVHDHNEYITEFLKMSPKYIQGEALILGLELDTTLLVDDEASSGDEIPPGKRGVHFDAMIKPAAQAVSEARLAEPQLWENPIAALGPKLEGHDTVFFNTDFILQDTHFHQADVAATAMSILELFRDRGYQKFVFDQSLFLFAIDQMAQLTRKSRRDLMGEDYREFIEQNKIDDFAQYMLIKDVSMTKAQQYANSIMNFIKTLSKKGIEVETVRFDEDEKLRQQLDRSSEKTVVVNKRSCARDDELQIQHSFCSDPNDLDEHRQFYIEDPGELVPSFVMKALVQAEATESKKFGDLNQAVAIDSSELAEPMKVLGLKRVPDFLVLNVSKDEEEDGGASLDEDGDDGASFEDGEPVDWNKILVGRR